MKVLKWKNRYKMSLSIIIESEEEARMLQYILNELDEQRLNDMFWTDPESKTFIPKMIKFFGRMLSLIEKKSGKDLSSFPTDVGIEVRRQRRLRKHYRKKFAGTDMEKLIRKD